MTHEQHLMTIDWFETFNQCTTEFELRFQWFVLTSNKSFRYVGDDYRNAVMNAYNVRLFALKQKRRTSMTSGANRAIVAR